MAVQTRAVDWKPKFEGGLRLPSGGSTSGVLVSDGEGNGTWAEVTSGRIGAEAVGTTKIANLAVTEGKLAENAVTEAKIKAEAVGTATIKKEAVKAEKIEKEAVTTEKIAKEAVTAATIKNATITGEKLAGSAVTSEKIKIEAVTEEKIATGAVTETKLGSEAVGATKIKNEAVTNSKLGAKAVTVQKVETASKPAPGAENSTTVGTSGIARKIVAVIVGNGTETKFKIKHEFNTYSVVVEIQNAETKRPNEISFAPAAKVTATTEAEIEVVFTAPPGKKEEFWVTVIG